MMPTEATGPTIRAAALEIYDSLGWFVLPADPRIKAPYQRTGGHLSFRWKPYGDKLPDRATVADWPHWNYPGVRVGVRTGAISGIIVLDCDSQAAHDYIKRMGHPPGPMVQSPREGGGLHIYFKHPGFNVKSTVGVGGIEGLDIRGDGGIVVVPPSLDHKSGRAYQWLIDPREVPVPECPAWLVDLLKKQSEFKEPLDVARTMAGVKEGERDSTLNRLAGKFRAMNIPQDVAEAMIQYAADRCSPPFNRAEARAKVIWAYTHYEAGEDLSPLLNISSKDENGSGFETFTLAALMEEEFPPVQWAVEGLIPEGTMLFAGKPKMGKSWMALGLCISVATGGKALGHFAVEEGDALYMALEENKRRIQSRARELLKSDLTGNRPPARLNIITRVAKKLDTGLLEDIEEWLKKHPEARLVVIDTLGSVRGRSTNSRTLYEQDYEIGAALTKLAGDYSVAILVIHHLKKGDENDPMDLISGSTGLTGGMDGALVLTRTRSAADGIIKAVHRDLEDDPEIALQKVEEDKGWWQYIGDAEEYQMSKERREIFEILAQEDRAMGPQEIADALGKPSQNVRKLLLKMFDEGYVERPGEYGKYVIAHGVGVPTLKTGHTDPSGHSETSSTGLSVTERISVTDVLGNEEEF